MKRILTAAAGGVLGAAGALGAAALMTAAPASAIPGCVPNIACDVVDQARELPNSILAQPGEFLNGDGEDNEGILNQPQAFLTNLSQQPGVFIDSANPVNQAQRFFTGTCDINVMNDCNFDEGDYVGILGQPRQFAENLASQPQTFADSIQRSIGAFGPDADEPGDPGAP
jgi:hypothetical protein